MLVTAEPGETLEPPPGAISGPYRSEAKALAACTRSYTCAVLGDSEGNVLPGAVRVSFIDPTGVFNAGSVVVPVAALGASFLFCLPGSPPCFQRYGTGDAVPLEPSLAMFNTPPFGGGTGETFHIGAHWTHGGPGAYHYWTVGIRPSGGSVSTGAGGITSTSPVWPSSAWPLSLFLCVRTETTAAGTDQVTALATPLFAGTITVIAPDGSTVLGTVDVYIGLP